MCSVQEFAEFAHGRDMAERVPGRTPLEMPYAIDGDKVGGQSIKYMFAKARPPSHALEDTVTSPAGQLLELGPSIAEASATDTNRGS